MHVCVLIQVLYEPLSSKYFLPLCGLSFNSLHKVFLRTEVLNFDEIQYVI